MPGGERGQRGRIGRRRVAAPDYVQIRTDQEKIVPVDVPRRGLPCGARHAYGGQADGRNREVPAALGAFAEFGFQHRGPAQATGDAGEDDGDIGGAERSDEEGEAWVPARCCTVAASCLP